MSTKIKDRVRATDWLRIDAIKSDPAGVALEFVDRYRNGIVEVPTADFLAAVASELDVIVIPRADLPEVRKDGTDSMDFRVEGGDVGGIYSDESTAQGARANAIAWLAIAEYLDAQVDEAEVKALTEALVSLDGRGQITEPDKVLARRLVAAGWKR